MCGLGIVLEREGMEKEGDGPLRRDFSFAIRSARALEKNLWTVGDMESGPSLR